MLIQITNRCRMMCPHCMDDARPDGGLMDFNTTFLNALKFAKTCGGMLLLSGGEPTEHPDFMDMCKEVSKWGFKFSVCTNGMWMFEPNQVYRFERIAKLLGFCGAQIYTNPKWYRLHDKTVRKYEENLRKWTSLKVYLDINEIRGMSDIGRAETCAKAIEETKASPYHNMCLKTHVSAVQCNDLETFTQILMYQGGFCKPLVDWEGNVHASESCLCQSFGNVNTELPGEIFDLIRAGRPCGKCIPCKRYLSEDDPKMVAARRLLGQQKQGE